MMPETKAFCVNKAKATAYLVVCLIMAFTVFQANADDTALLMDKQFFDLGLQAIPSSDGSDCAIQLIWIDLEQLLQENGFPPQPLFVYRSEIAYPGDDGSGGDVVYAGSTAQKGLVDSDVAVGVEYYYTLAVGTYGTQYFLSDTARGSCTGSNLGLRASALHDIDGKCYIALTWQSVGEPVSLYRSTLGYSSPPDSQLVFGGSKEDNIWLDENVTDGLQYFYTLVAGQDIIDPKAVSFASAVACDDPMPVYTEVFNNTNPFDLAYSQIIFRPVKEDPHHLTDDLSDMSYADYEVTVLNNVTELPVPRSDHSGFGRDLALGENMQFPVQIGGEKAASVFFFGKRYSTLTVSANGYISFQEQFGTAPFKQTTMVEEHFSEPRIAFFNSALMPQLGGTVWVRLFDDSIVFTFQNVTIKAPTGMLNPDRITAQVEVFFSGHIRMTYLEATMHTGLIGISDGRGVPAEPSGAYPALGLSGAHNWVPFDSLPEVPQRISLLPIAWPAVTAGERISFIADMELPPGTGSVPAFYGLWSGEGAAPFTDRGDGTGLFDWTPAITLSGFYKVRVVALLGAERVFQDVILTVRSVDPRALLPRALKLQLSSREGDADPEDDHAVYAGEPLFASYTYEHPLAKENPALYGEGATRIYWYKNGQIVTAYTDRSSVPSGVTRFGDEWRFQVIPRTKSDVAGNPASSPTVTVVSTPVISTVTPATGTVLGGDRVVIHGSQLKGVIQVTFGGIPAAQVIARADGALEVTTPPHSAGLVTVVVETVTGAVSKVNAFKYVDEPKVPDPEKRRNIFGCGVTEDGSGSSLTADLLAALALLLMLGLKSRRAEQQPQR